MAKAQKLTDLGGATCGACLHWQVMHDVNEDVGECYLNPPTSQVDEDGYISIRPIVERDCRTCSHFKGSQ